MSEFRVVAKTNEIATNSVKAVDLEGNEIAIANIDGTYLAFGAQCGCISVFVGHHDEEGVDGHFHVGTLVVHSIDDHLNAFACLQFAEAGLLND